MRALGELAGMALVAALLTGCTLLHLKKQPPQGPPLQTGTGSIEQKEKKTQQPPPPSTLPQPSEQTAPPPSLPPAKPPKVKRSKKKRPPENVQSPAPQPANNSSAAPGAPASPIGPLSTGDTGTGLQTKHETLSLITQTEQGLGGIKRSLSSEEQDTTVQIRTFLTQARQALDNGDADGAHTLATKAKLLLDELTKK